MVQYNIEEHGWMLVLDFRLLVAFLLCTLVVKQQQILLSFAPLS
jgi:hypothetical protein